MRILIVFSALPQFVVTVTVQTYMPVVVGRPESSPSSESINPSGKLEHVHIARVTNALPLVSEGHFKLSS